MGGLQGKLLQHASIRLRDSRLRQQLIVPQASKTVAAGASQQSLVAIGECGYDSQISPGFSGSMCTYKLTVRRRPAH